eukprot:6437017-Amphidinium_carterae.1
MQISPQMIPPWFTCPCAKDEPQPNLAFFYDAEEVTLHVHSPCATLSVSDRLWNFELILLYMLGTLWKLLGNLASNQLANHGLRTQMLRPSQEIDYPASASVVVIKQQAQGKELLHQVA